MLNNNFHFCSTGQFTQCKVTQKVNSQQCQSSKCISGDTYSNSGIVDYKKNRTWSCNFLISNRQLHFLPLVSYADLWVSGFFAPLPVCPLAHSPLGWFAFWLIRPLACSPPGWFAPSPWTICPRWISVIRHWGLYVICVFRPRQFMHDEENKQLCECLMLCSIMK